MKPLALLLPAFLLALACQAQDTIVLPVIVTGATQSSSAAQPSDFNVEVNHTPVPVASVASLAGQHLQYVLVNNQNVHPQWPGGKEQQVHVASEFLRQVISAGSDIGTLVNYGDQVFIDVQNESDPRKLSRGLSRGSIPPNRLYDAVSAATNWLAKQVARPDVRKVMFLVCDGRESESHVTLADAIRTLQKVSVPLFVFAPSDVEKKKEGQNLRELAGQAGGRVYFLSPDRHLTFDAIKRDLADSFLLALNPPPSKGLLPLSVSYAGHPQVPVLSASQIFVP
jgi:hypothetical protein